MSLAALALAAAAGGGLYAAAVEPRLLFLRRPFVRSPHWPATAPAIRIGIIADLHAAWPHVTPARIARIAARLAAERPDLILLPGDFVSTRTRFVRHVPPEPVARSLALLPRVAPTLAVLGNHDWHLGGERVAAPLEANGIAVLRNRAVRLRLRGTVLWVAGIDDLWTGHADPGRALAAVDGSAPLIVLSHVPDIFPQLPAAVLLTVAGHTHGGQVRLPFYGPVITMSDLPRELAYGLHEVEGRFLYISGGVGTTKWPIRFARPPEIALLTLAPAGH